MNSPSCESSVSLDSGVNCLAALWLDAPTGRLARCGSLPVGRLGRAELGSSSAPEIVSHLAILSLLLDFPDRAVEINKLALGVVVLHANHIVLFNLRAGPHADEAAALENLARQLGIAQVAAHALAQVDVLEAVDAPHGLQARDAERQAVHAVHEAEDHVVLRVDVENAAADDGAQRAPVRGGRGRGRADEDH
ncbi:hypothetical protein TPAR_00821, partial [Tolypocladium paradoxum]